VHVLRLISDLFLYGSRNAKRDATNPLKKAALIDAMASLKEGKILHMSDLLMMCAPDLLPCIRSYLGQSFCCVLRDCLRRQVELQFKVEFKI